MSKKSETVTIEVSNLCHDMLHRAADRSGTNVVELVNMAATSMLSSLAKHLPSTPPPLAESAIESKCVLEKKVSISRTHYNLVRRYAQALEISPLDMMQDAILAQKFNLDRFQPVNARSFNSCRVRLYFIEQGGGVTDGTPGGSSSETAQIPSIDVSGRKDQYGHLAQRSAQS